MEFVAVDVETANHSPASICQIGIACFRNGVQIETWGVLVNPEAPFLSFNTRIHGIGPQNVSGAPTWPELRPKLRSLLEHRTIASHTYFDRTAMNGADMRYGLSGIPVAGWLDTCGIARRVWPHLANHKLPNLARNFGLSYQAHDAIDDARCAGQVLLLAGHASSLDFSEMLFAAPTGGRRRRYWPSDENERRPISCPPDSY
jgi:DNA polymerase-3 subunit epsilon